MWFRLNQLHDTEWIDGRILIKFNFATIGSSIKLFNAERECHYLQASDPEEYFGRFR